MSSLRYLQMHMCIQHRIVLIFAAVLQAVVYCLSAIPPRCPLFFIPWVFHLIVDIHEDILPDGVNIFAVFQRLCLFFVHSNCGKNVSTSPHPLGRTITQNEFGFPSLHTFNEGLAEYLVKRLRSCCSKYLSMGCQICVPRCGYIPGGTEFTPVGTSQPLS